MSTHDLSFVYKLIDTNKKLVEKIYQLKNVIELYETQTVEKSETQIEASQMKEELLKQVEEIL